MHDVGDFVPQVLVPDQWAADALAFPFVERDLLTSVGKSGPRILCHHEVETLESQGRLVVRRRQSLGLWRGRQAYSMELEPLGDPPDGHALSNLRRLAPTLAQDHFWLAARAVQIVAWDRDHQFCGRCAAPTEVDAGERVRRCRRCNLSVYPRISPAVIVLVERGHEILLARSPHFAPGVYSTLAGFVEAGESLETTVAREIFEEVGVAVTNIRYFGSQPWPFPNSLMIGFRADYAGGEIAIDGVEIVDAAWFSPDDLPTLPFSVSIARSLIEAFLAEHRSAI